MEQLQLEIKRTMEAIGISPLEESVFAIDIADIPPGMTAEEFAAQWKEHQSKGELIYISRT